MEDGPLQLAPMSDSETEEEQAPRDKHGKLISATTGTGKGNANAVREQNFMKRRAKHSYHVAFLVILVSCCHSMMFAFAVCSQLCLRVMRSGSAILFSKDDRHCNKACSHSQREINSHRSCGIADVSMCKVTFRLWRKRRPTNKTTEAKDVYPLMRISGRFFWTIGSRLGS